MENKTQGEGLCEKLEAALYCGEELSVELKEHIDNCPRCKKLLEDENKLVGELSGINLTGIGDGEIANAVMKKISASKNRKSGFKFSHHMGTAAAIVIICAAALYVKYFPTSEDGAPVALGSENEASAQEEKSSPILEDTYFLPLSASEKPEQESEEAAESNDADGYESENGYNAVYDTASAMYGDEEAMPEQQEVLLKSVKPHDVQSENTEVNTYSLTGSTNMSVRQSAFGITTDEYTDGFIAAASPDTDKAAEASEPEVTSQETENEKDGTLSSEDDIYYAANSEDSDSAEVPLRASGGGGAGGGSADGGGGSSSASKLTADNGDIYSDTYLVFGGMEFLQGEENLDINISLANSRLGELYGDGRFVITRYALENNGWNGNAFFFNDAPGMTYSRLVGIENSSCPIGG